MKTLTNFLIDFARTFIADEHGGSLAIAAYNATSVAIAVESEQYVAAVPYQINLQANVTDFGVTAGGTNEYDPQFHEIEYIWSIVKVGDSGWAAETYSAVPDIPSSMLSKGTRYGKRISYVLGKDEVASGTPATFQFTVTAVNLATGAFATSTTLERTISHPDDVFSAAQTYVVRTTSATNYPTTSNSIYATPGDAFTAATSANQELVRICMERGQSYDRIRGGKPEGASTKAIMFDTWGSSPDPTALGTDSTASFKIYENMTANTESFQVSGFSITGGGRTFSSNGPSGLNDDMCVTIDDFQGSGGSLLIERVGGIGAGFLAFHNCTFDGHPYCGGLSAFDEFGGKRISLSATRLEDDPDRSSDNISAGDTSAGGGGWKYRTTVSPDGLFFYGCQIFNRQGWFNNVSGISTQQPLMRITALDGRPFVVSNCILEGGAYEGLIRMTESGDSAVHNTLIERNLMLGSHMARAFMVTRGSGVTVRNNVMVKAPSRPAHGIDMEWFVINFGADDAVQDTVPYRVYNNTYINLGTGPTVSVDLSAADAVVAANNINHQPFADTPIDAGSFSLTEIRTALFNGYKTTETGEAPLYLAAPNTDTIPWAIGETVTGGTNSYSKVYAGRRSRFRDGSGGGLAMIAFEMTALSDNLSNSGFEQFVSTEVLTGSSGSVTLDVRMGDAQQVVDSTLFAIDLIPYTITPTHYIDYDAESAAFTEGNTLTNGTASATICRVQDNGTTGRLWLRDITGGTFADNDSLTESDGSGAATANGGQQSAGTGAVWVPTSAVTPDTATWATTPYARRDFFGTTSHNSKGAVRV